jgi:hypothetical protein
VPSDERRARAGQDAPAAGVWIRQRPPARAHETSHGTALVASPCCRHRTSLTPHCGRRVAKEATHVTASA